MKNFIPLETERLLLIRLLPEDFEELFRTKSEAEIIAFLGLKNHEEFIEQKLKSSGGYKTYDRSISAFLIILKSTKITIGRCGFHNWYPFHKKAEIGYVIFDEENRNKGYMNEAMDAVLNYGFSKMNLNRIEATASPKNLPSIKILENYGFVKEGLLRQHFMRNDILEDSQIFSLLKEDFK